MRLGWKEHHWRGTDKAVKDGGGPGGAGFKRNVSEVKRHGSIVKKVGLIAELA